MLGVGRPPGGVPLPGPADRLQAPGEQADEQTPLVGILGVGQLRCRPANHGHAVAHSGPGRQVQGLALLLRSAPMAPERALRLLAALCDAVTEAAPEPPPGALDPAWFEVTNPSGDAGTVWQVDPRAMTIEATIRLTRPIAAFGDVEPYGIAAGAGSLWVTVTVAP